jgi:hypothetical protein
VVLHSAGVPAGAFRGLGAGAEEEQVVAVAVGHDPRVRSKH